MRRHNHLLINLIVLTLTSARTTSDPASQAARPTAELAMRCANQLPDCNPAVGEDERVGDRRQRLGGSTNITNSTNSTNRTNSTNSTSGNLEGNNECECRLRRELKDRFLLHKKTEDAAVEEFKMRIKRSIDDQWSRFVDTARELKDQCTFQGT
jgi:hypothetical protein